MTIQPSGFPEGFFSCVGGVLIVKWERKEAAGQRLRILR